VVVAITIAAPNIKAIKALGVFLMVAIPYFFLKYYLSSL
jgi:hypothetical protein